MSDKMLNDIVACAAELVIGIVGFVLSCIWWKTLGRTLDRSATLFIAKMSAGIAVFGMILVFVF